MTDVARLWHTNEAAQIRAITDWLGRARSQERRGGAGDVSPHRMLFGHPGQGRGTGDRRYLAASPRELRLISRAVRLTRLPPKAKYENFGWLTKNGPLPKEWR